MALFLFSVETIEVFIASVNDQGQLSLTLHLMHHEGKNAAKLLRLLGGKSH
jgi:hypothetical protein